MHEWAWPRFLSNGHDIARHEARKPFDTSKLWHIAFLHAIMSTAHDFLSMRHTFTLTHTHIDVSVILCVMHISTWIAMEE